MRYWDSSALVPLLVGQDVTEAILRTLDDDDEIATWWGTPVECASAVARLERDLVLSRDGGERARERLASLAGAWDEVQPTEEVRREAARLLRIHPLRAADALQGAAAVVLAEHDPATLDVVCLDARLGDALRKEGFRLRPAP